MNNSRLISLIIVFLILLVLSLIPILSGKTVFQLSKGSQEDPFQYYKTKRATFKEHVEVTGSAFLLASGLHELICDVSMVAHSFQPFFMLAPIGIVSMGVLFSTPSMPNTSLSPWLPLIMKGFCSNKYGG
jgi:hypothetical protein